MTVDIRVMDKNTWAFMKEILSRGPDAIRACFHLSDDITYDSIFKMPFEDVVKDYENWCKEGRPTGKFRKGDIVRCFGKYCVVINYDENVKIWYMLTSEGKLDSHDECGMAPEDMHLDLNVVTINGTIEFLKKLEESYERLHSRV